MYIYRCIHISIYLSIYRYTYIFIYTCKTRKPGIVYAIWRTAPMTATAKEEIHICSPSGPLIEPSSQGCERSGASLIQERGYTNEVEEEAGEVVH